MRVFWILRRWIGTNGLHPDEEFPMKSSQGRACFSFSVDQKSLLCYKQKNPRDGVLGFGGIAKCLINTALYIGEESHV